MQRGTRSDCLPYESVMCWIVPNSIRPENDGRAYVVLVHGKDKTSKSSGQILVTDDLNLKLTLYSGYARENQGL